eukprot:CAMPEP_0176451720 /NCGR_PEP_ID=MMETSP0127-20121128/28039_1 /TAXON_ID=938130 /ORGANISM="Platyophrya macrostoma, Strain WH" /LENGTH=65 /DNA_ID=CAMNT_0017839899 /DNA_START=63 /DNA_END=257 /DNA_ORIENTATION=-
MGNWFSSDCYFYHVGFEAAVRNKLTLATIKAELGTRCNGEARHSVHIVWGHGADSANRAIVQHDG